jgi:hypothetical protein
LCYNKEKLKKNENIFKKMAYNFLQTLVLKVSYEKHLNAQISIKSLYRSTQDATISNTAAQNFIRDKFQ